MRFFLALLGAMGACSMASAYVTSTLCSPTSRLTAARSALSHRSTSHVARRGLLGLRAAEPEQSEEDKAKSKALAEAWIRGDKSQELKGLLNGASIYLVGLPGCNNDKIGAMLAKRLDIYSFLDLKEVFAAAAGKPECLSYEALKKEIGEEEFRDLETKVLDQVQAVLRLIVSTDHGVVTDVANWSKMQNGLVVHLKGDIGVMSEKSGMEESAMKALAEEYGGFYQLADVSVTLDKDEAIDTAAIKVVDSIMELIKNNPPMRKGWEKAHDERMAALDAEEAKKKNKGKPGKPPGKGFGPSDAAPKSKEI